MFVGVGASRVRDLFERAKQAAPSIIFIDEIDAVGRQRGAGLGGGHDEREQTLNQLLVEMDGFEENSSVILIAATNRVDILDPALLRPGRFDRQIVVDRPDLKGREQILRVHSQGKPLAHSVDLEALARLTPGFTGADLANLMNEAALLTARKGKKLVTMSELNEAMEREIAGPERKSRIITEKEKKVIAYHESGHALVGHVLENSDPVHKISIISRGQALGYTLSLPTEDRFLNSREEMYDDLAVFLGGRVAEELFCDDITTGASNDLERATKMARQMVTRYGMTDALGSQVYGEANHEVFLGRDYSATPDYSDATARRIDEEVSKIIRKAHVRASEVLVKRKSQIELMVAVLLERETVDGEALAALLNDTWDDYIANEDDILAKKAEDLRKQEEDDERRRAEEERKAAEQAALQEMGSEGNAPGDPRASARAAIEAARQGRYTLDDVFSGRVNIEDLMNGRLPQPAPPTGQPVIAAPQPPADAPQPLAGLDMAPDDELEQPEEFEQPDDLEPEEREAPEALEPEAPEAPEAPEPEELGAPEAPEPEAPEPEEREAPKALEPEAPEAPEAPEPEELEAPEALEPEAPEAPEAPEPLPFKPAPEFDYLEDEAYKTIPQPIPKWTSTPPLPSSLLDKEEEDSEEDEARG
jgi:cell division protease FtsH